MAKKVERIDIKGIKEPSFVKGLDYESLSLLCEDIRSEILDITSRFGGHLSSNLGVVELTVALHRNFDFPKDKLIFDVSHQCYTHKILTGRSLENLNAKNGVSGFTKRSESEYDCYEAGHSSTSLSAAEGFAVSRDLKKEDNYIVSVIGDGSLVNGLSFEALNHIGGRYGKFIIVLNDNDMSISHPVGGLGSFFRNISTAKSYNRFKKNYRKVLGTNGPGRWIYKFSAYMKDHVKRTLVGSNLFDNLGYTYMGPFDGHNIKTLDKAFKRAKNASKGVIMHVYTHKGRGYKPAEDDQIGYWHGTTPFNIETGTPKNQHPGYHSWPHIVGNLTKEALSKHSDSVLIVPAMIKGSHMEGCFAEFPERSIDVGIAEEHAFTMAGSMAISGLHPIICIYSTFLQRSYDELLHDCARLNADMTLLIDRAGLVGKDGETHMGIYDEAFLKSIPNVSLYMPSTLEEMKATIEYSMKKGHGIVGIRYPHTLVKDDGEEIPSIEIEPWIKLSEGNGEEAVVSVGPKGRELLNELESKGYEGSRIQALKLFPLPDEEIKKLAKYEKIFVYDSYGTKNGFVEALGNSLIENNFKGEFKSFAVPNTFVQHSSIPEQEELFGLDIQTVLKEIL